MTGQRSFGSGPRSPVPTPLRREIDEVLALRGPERAERILESPTPGALVAVMPPEELFFTLREMESDDVPALLALARPEQLEFVLDLELWGKDELTGAQVAPWLGRLAACGPEALVRWFQKIDLSTWTLLLGRLARVQVAGDDADPFQDQPGKAPFTLDGLYYVAASDAHEPLLRQILLTLREADAERCTRLFEALVCDVDAELEEYCREERGRRLAGRGLPEWEEAMEVYAKLEVTRAAELPPRAHGPAPADLREPAAAPPYPLALPGAAPDLLARALRRLGGSAASDAIRAELAYLTNKVLAADGLPLGRLESYDQSLRKTAAYASIGLEALCGYDDAEAARVIEHHWLQSLFRVGWTRIRRLRSRARTLFQRGWPQGHKERLLFLDAPLPETLDGLLRPHPLWYAGDAEPSPYRLFRTLGEVHRAQNRIEKADFLGRFLLGVVDLRLGDLREAVSHLDAENLKGTTVFLTALVNAALGRGFRFGPVARHEVHDGLARIWEGDLPPRRVRVGLLDSALEWCRAVAPIAPADEPHLREFVAECFSLLEDEFGRLPPTEIPDPRFTRGLWIE
ncbi:MAG: DUF6178 family protein [Deferrisomatales bacterium]